jgi:argininosuccinate lyase
MAGTTFPIDREFVARELGFSRVSENSMDAVSDRDFVIETLSALSILMMHLSRLSEELILWNSREFGVIEMGDNVTTGSSIMPQKKNPDVAELIRGKTGRVYGDLMSVLTMMKGLPLAYNKDMQEDKEPLFDAVDTARACLTALAVLLTNLTFHSERMKTSLRGDFSTATDLADYLASIGIPFREAHETVGRIVADCLRRGTVLEDLTSTDLIQYTSAFADAPDDITSVERSVERREARGGTGRLAVLAQLKEARECLSKT